MVINDQISKGDCRYFGHGMQTIRRSLPIISLYTTIFNGSSKNNCTFSLKGGTLLLFKEVLRLIDEFKGLKRSHGIWVSLF